MSKRDFIVIAEALRQTKPKDGAALDSHAQWQQDCNAIADVLRGTNPRFLRERWLGFIDGTNGPSGGRGK